MKTMRNAVSNMIVKANARNCMRILNAFQNAIPTRKNMMIPQPNLAALFFSSAIRNSGATIAMRDNAAMTMIIFPNTITYLQYRVQIVR